jgi:hypothetical protein
MQQQQQQLPGNGMQMPAQPQSYGQQGAQMNLPPPPPGMGIHYQH